MELEFPTDLLKQEHRRIERMLEALTVFAGSLGGESADERVTVSSFVDFFRTFADRIHHGKEETILFEKLVELGMSVDSGPIAVMLEEHRIGRALVGRLEVVGQGSGPLSDTECAEVSAAAGEFAAMLAAHIQKEDSILFELAERMMPDEVRQQVASEFVAFQEREELNGTNARMLALADELASVARG